MEPIIHRAVLNEALEELKELCKDPNQLLVRNGPGLTALELARYLNKPSCIEILHPHPSPKQMHIILPGYHSLLPLTPKQFLNTFGVRYTSYLYFPNYEVLKEVIRNRPWILRTRLASENWELGERYQNELNQGYVADLIIQWINDAIGYGIIANRDFPKGTFIGEYTGMVRRLHRFHKDSNPYCMHYPTRFWSLNYFITDALKVGNELRFINHSAEPNIEPQCAIDRGILHSIFITNQEIKKGEELLFNYRG